MDPDADPLVRGVDARIQIRIHIKMSLIRNTNNKSSVPATNGSQFELNGGPVAVSLV